MSALAIYLERAGITTVVVGLVRPHLEKTQPPRALWVPFELGRPLGSNTRDNTFSKQVLSTALQLLERADGPVILEDFTLEDPGATADDNWQAPACSDATSATQELELLMPVWQQAKLKLGRTMAGLSGMSPEQACHYLQAFVSEQPAPNPDNTMSEILRLRFCADDIKTIYTEAALANGSPSSRQINEWIFNNTQLGILLRDIRSRNLEHEDSTRATVCGRMLIPGAYL